MDKDKQRAYARSKRTSESYQKTANTSRQKYGADYYSRIGAMGGKAKGKPKGFAYMAIHDPERLKKIARRHVAWTRVEGGNNMILTKGNLTVSYNPIAGVGNGNPLGHIAQMIGGMFNGEDKPQEETALHDGKTWRILLGDFRKEYEEVFPDLKKCIAVYDKHKEAHRSGWSTDDD